MPSVPVVIRIPVPYPVGPPSRVLVANGTTPYQLIWEAAGAGITFGDDPPNEDFFWKTGTGQPTVSSSVDGKTLTSNVYTNDGGTGATWSYGVTIFKDGADPITIDPVIENVPPTENPGQMMPGQPGRPPGGGGRPPGGGQPGRGPRPGPPPNADARGSNKRRGR